jgi:hypothetical protein
MHKKNLAGLGIKRSDELLRLQKLPFFDPMRLLSIHNSAEYDW